jgi:hypothetical protein
MVTKDNNTTEECDMSETQQPVNLDQLREDANKAVTLYMLVCPQCKKISTISKVMGNTMQKHEKDNGNLLCPVCGSESTKDKWGEVTTNYIKKHPHVHDTYKHMLREQEAAAAQTEEPEEAEVPDVHEESADRNPWPATLATEMRKAVKKDMKCSCGALDSAEPFVDDKGNAYVICSVCGKTLAKDTDEHGLYFNGKRIAEILDAVEPRYPASSNQAEEPVSIIDQWKEAVGLNTAAVTREQENIVGVCIQVCEMLLEKNRKYGNSALNPVRIFSKASPLEQIKVRLDDKLSRLRSEQPDEDEDVVNDIIGYCILFKVASKQMKEDAAKQKEEA